MRGYSRALLAALILLPTKPVCAGETDATAILDKAIKALGGEEKLGKIKAFSWTVSGVKRSQGQVRQLTMEATFSGLDRARRELRSSPLYHLTVVDRDRGWHKLRLRVLPMDDTAIAAEKRSIYLQVVPTLLVPLKSHAFKVEFAGEEKVDEKPALVLKITGPDGKDFLLYFDKENFLPIKEVFRSVGPDGHEQTEETTFADYKDMGGIKKATSVEVRTGPERANFLEITRFQVLDHVDPADFAAPR